MAGRSLVQVRTGAGNQRGFAPILARTQTVHSPVGPVAYDCVKLIVVRSGSAILFSEFGQKPVNVGDAILLGANVLCGSEPEGRITVTTIYLDTDYVVDQVFWQHAAVLTDRLEAKDFFEARYAEPAQVLRLGEDRAGCLMPWLDELGRLSLDGPAPERFY
ncbi:AraC family transcriptional regulator, partial [Brachybacterium paraconglomeratum]|nr:AraC family transcriptional regulator [Brachybacterium paraconglomeratum]